MKTLILCTVVSCVISLFTDVNAELIDRGGGLIYDDILDVTWLQDANHAQTSGYDLDGRMTWDEAVAWADQLEYYDSRRDVTWTDWRLPQTLPVDGLAYDYGWTHEGGRAYDGSADNGYSVSAPGSAYPGSTGSEMAHLYYTTLGNLAYYDLDGNPRESGWGMQNAGPFVNLLQDRRYWSGVLYVNLNDAWGFDFNDGCQRGFYKFSVHPALAVRSGDVGAVPIGGAGWLLGSGLVGIVALRSKHNKGRLRG